MLLVVAVWFFLIVWPQTDSILGRATTLGHVSGEKGWQYRQEMTAGTISMIKERPLSGFGIGQYPYYEQQYTNSGIPTSCIGGDRPKCPGCTKETQHTPTVAGTINIRPTLGEQAHNFYLQTAAELGIPGLLLVA